MSTIIHSRERFDILSPLRRWVDQIKICDRRIAHLICRLIPCWGTAGIRAKWDTL